MRRIANSLYLRQSNALSFAAASGGTATAFRWMASEAAVDELMASRKKKDKEDKKDDKEVDKEKKDKNNKGTGGSGGGGSAGSTTTPSSTTTTETTASTEVKDMHPKQLMAELDKHIVGQKDAKKAVSIALRNRWRRQRVEADMREEIAPKNILMVGPTGVGKTEIARRLAKLVDAPFVKVEATKYTEVGFHGKDVDTIIEDLYKAALAQTKQVLMKRNEEAAKIRAEDRILQALAGAAGSFREHLRSGALDSLEIMIDVLEKKETPKTTASGEGVTFNLDIPAMMGMGNKRPRTIKKNMKIKDAMQVVLQEELEKMVETADVQKEALRACEEDGIVVIDEIDKIVASPSAYKGHQASAEGVQQDLLPIVEGTTVTLKSGVQVKTDKILFICSGAFHMVKVSDMLAELQGRLPIRVSLTPLTKDDFYRIVTEPKYNLIAQHTAMMATEGVTLNVTDDAKWEIARIAAQVNATIQNIGARRLITITEKIMEEISFDGPEKKGETFTIDAAYVQKAVAGLVSKVDISKYLL